MKKYMIALATVACVGMAQGALVHHWEFNGDATDSVGSNDGTLNGNAALEATGGFEGSGYASFDGAIGSYVSTGVTYDPNSTFTWALWAKIGDDTDGSAIIMGNRRDGVTGGGGADFTPREFVKITGQKTIFRPGDTANDVDYADLTVAAGWTHLAVVKSGSTVTSYENGVLSTNVTLTGTFTAAALPLFLGGDNTTRGVEFFNGGVDDVRVYDNALTGAEVAALVPEPGTLGLVALFGGGVLFIRRRFMI